MYKYIYIYIYIYIDTHKKAGYPLVQGTRTAGAVLFIIVYVLLVIIIYVLLYHHLSLHYSHAPRAGSEPSEGKAGRMYIIIHLPRICVYL